MSTTFKDMDVKEDDVLKFNFAPALRDGETLASAVVDITVTAGNDPKPELALVGAAQLQGALALQQFTAHAAPVTYHFRCVGTLSTGRKVTIAADMQVVRA